MNQFARIFDHAAHDIDERCQASSIVDAQGTFYDTTQEGGARRHADGSVPLAALYNLYGMLYARTTPPGGDSGCRSGLRMRNLFNGAS